MRPWWWICAGCVLAGACSGDDLQVFRSDGTAGVGGGAAGGDGGPPGASCQSAMDCPPFWVCARSRCDAPTGVCEAPPVICPSDPDPVCGCDGISYWNDCLRSQFGVPALSSGECRQGARPCNSGVDCGPGGNCARLYVNGSCQDIVGRPPPPGTCWRLPGMCTPGSSPQLWQFCEPPRPDPSPPICGDPCIAIRSELPHVQGRPEICY